MERILKAQTMLSQFERGLNPLPEAAQDEAIVLRLAGADGARLDAYFQLYGIRLGRQDLRLFTDGSDQVYVLTWPGPLFKSHWEQQLTPKTLRRRRA
jgi:hypothetical protein